MRTSRQLPKAQLQALITGIPTYCANTIFSVAGQTYTAPQAVAFLTTVLDASTGRTAARAALVAAMQAEEKVLAQDGQVAREIRDSIALMFSNVPPALSAFEIVPRKMPKPLSVEERALATAKARATREARGTTSKKKKARVTGGVTGVTITPVMSASPSAQAATPPATASSATPATSSGQTTSATATHP